MDPHEVRAVVAAYFDCVNHERWDAFPALFHDDVESRPVDGPPRHGRDDVLAMYPVVLAPFPEHRDEPVRVLVSGSTAAVDIRFTGRLADGRVVEFDAIDVFELENGLIRRLSYWYDAAAITAELSAGARDR